MNITKVAMQKLTNQLNNLGNKMKTITTTTNTTTTIQSPITVGNQTTTIGTSYISSSNTGFSLYGYSGLSGFSGITGTTDHLSGYYNYKVKIKSGDQEYEISKSIQIEDCDVHMFFAIEKQKNFVKWDISKEQKAKMNKLKLNAKLKKISKLDAEKKESGGDTSN